MNGLIYFLYMFAYILWAFSDKEGKHSTGFALLLCAGLLMQ